MKQVAQGFTDHSAYLPPEGVTYADEYELDGSDAAFIADKVLDTVEEYMQEEQGVDAKEYRKAMEQLAIEAPDLFIGYVEEWAERGWVSMQDLVADILEAQSVEYDESDNFDE